MGTSATKSAPRVLFLALATYSRMGGIQRFNQRVIGGLCSASQACNGPAPVVHFMDDTAEDLPTDTGAQLIGHGRHRFKFISGAMKAARSADIILAGHINLLPVAALCKLANPRAKLLLFVHGDDVWNDPAFRLRRPYDSPLLRWVDRIASVSQFTANRMSSEFGVPPEKYIVFPNAVDPLSVPANHQPGSKTILTVTRFDWHDRTKNVDSIIKALPVLRERVPEITLEVVGDGPLRPELEQLAETLGVSDNIRFLGRVSDEELMNCYARAGVFVLPSSKEGFGIVYLEAWRHEIPVICGTDDAAQEVVTDGVDGFTADPRNTDALADKIALVLLDPELASKMGKSGAEKVRTRYLDKHFRSNLVGLLEALA